MKRRKCNTKFCRGNPVPGRLRCEKCRRREWRSKNPEHDKYLNLKSNAKRRGIEVTITFEQFKNFCRKTKYAAKCGRGKNTLTIDRVDAKRGYHLDNIQVMTGRMNSMKWHQHDKKIRDIDPALIEQQEYTPFESAIDLPGVNTPPPILNPSKSQYY